ncbi:MAG TPA: serine/threonine-protein kinase, partial [Thermoanaerobaculia bacterium]|nr:serine/threonine-protein kinase [Thermoanaerobaculia bacterium]
SLLALGAIFPMWFVVEELNALLTETLLPFLLWTFTREFPRVLRLDRWAPLVQAAVRTSGALGLVLFSVNVFARLMDPEDLSKVSVYTALRYCSLGLFLLCLPVPFVAWRRSRQASDDERRRARWFLSGLAFWLMPWGARWLMLRGESFWFTTPGAYLQLLMVPLMTYAVIAPRLPGVRLLLSNAARLALSRGSALGLAMLPTGLLLLRLFEQRHRPILEVATDDRVLLLFFFAVLFWAYYLLHGKAEKVPVGRRKDPALALTLASFSRDAQNARTIGELERLVQERLDDLVSPRSSVLLLRDPARSSYAAIASGPRPLAASSSLVRLAEEVSPEPFSLSVEDRGSLLGLLTAEDRSWITEADPELIVPLASSRGETVALFVLGPKRSGLPYTRDEQQAVTAFTAAASLALENVASLGDRAWGLDAAEEPAGECRRCGHVALRAEGLCACMRPLAPAAIPYEFAGKFRLDRVLGEGGMGVVYRATDLALGRQVALKTLPRLGSEALQRLRREARSMAGFLHPNLALIFGAETWRGVPILVVEYLAGGSLASRLGEPMAPREVLRLGMDLAGALEAMHDRGLLHRDVKPSNIGFTGGGVPKLLDFGLARLHEEAHFEVPVLDPGISAIADEKLRLTLTGQVVGTPLYMAPEALAGALPSPAHDLWSLHLVLWEALAGRHPFAGMSLEAAVRRMAREEIPDIRTVRPDCPAEISRLLVRALHLNADHRPATAGAVREAFLGAGWTA